jgi:AmmeMemoRadiSam system protein A
MAEHSEATLNANEKRVLLQIARKTLGNWVRRHESLSDAALRDFELTDALRQRTGVFVTLHKKGELRGCIGYITGSSPVYKAVIENTVNAASNDPRFSPVTESELPDIDIEISVMSPLEEIRGPEEIEVGKHGIVVERDWSKGLLLPQVATEWRWDRYEFLEQTCLKAGLPRKAWKKGAKIYCFSAQVFGEREVSQE